MSESVESALTESERALAQELFGQLDLEMPHELEWEANSRLMDLRSIPDLGIEMRYNIKMAHYDEESRYHYWTYTSGADSVTLVIAQDSAEYASQVAESGQQIEGDGPVFTPIFLGELERETLFQMDLAGTLNLDDALHEMNESEEQGLREVSEYWEQSDYLPDSVWLFLSHQMLGHQRATAQE